VRYSILEIQRRILNTCCTRKHYATSTLIKSGASGYAAPIARRGSTSVKTQNKSRITILRMVSYLGKGNGELIPVFVVFKARVDMGVFRQLADLAAAQSKPLLRETVYLN